MNHSRPDPAALAVAREFQRQANPLQTILFGSRARGDHRPDSDVDLMVLDTRQPDPERTDRTARAIIKNLLPEANGIDVVHMTPEQYLANRLLRNNLANSVYKWGVPTLPSENLEYGSEYEKEEIDWKDVRDRISDALGFAKDTEQSEPYKFSDKGFGHNAGKALENAYKALLGANGFEYPTSGREGHNLSRIIGKIHENLNIPEDQPIPGENHSYLTEFSGAAIYSHEHMALDQTRINKEIPEAVHGIMDWIEQTTGYDPYEL